MADYAKRIKATTEDVNHIQYGKLLLAAKVGELCPAEKGGRGKINLHTAGEGFHPNTLTAYRKLTKHQLSGKLDTYWDETCGGGESVFVKTSGWRPDLCPVKGVAGGITFISPAAVPQCPADSRPPTPRCRSSAMRTSAVNRLQRKRRSGLARNSRHGWRLRRKNGKNAAKDLP